MNAVTQGSQSGLVLPGTVAVVPALIADRGQQAAWRHLEFFTVSIRNPNTRAAYARAASGFSPGARG